MGGADREQRRDRVCPRCHVHVGSEPRPSWFLSLQAKSPREAWKGREHPSH